MRVEVLSDTIQVFNGERFYLCGNYFQHKGKRLRLLREDVYCKQVHKTGLLFA